MLNDHSVGVVIPCRESWPAVRLLIQDLPAFVDRVIVVDDASQDGSAAHLRRAHDPRTRAGARLTLLLHPEPRGLGAAVVTGYRALLAAGTELVVVAWPGDALDPGEIEALLTPLIERRADLVSGSRLGEGAPRLGRLRGLVTARLLGWAIGSGGIADAACAHHAVTSVTLRRLALSELARGEAFPLDLISHARREGLVTEVAALRPFHRRRHHLPPESVWIIGRAALRRLRLRRHPRVLAANARARARVAAARPVGSETRRQLPDPT
ncbi:MAG: glycosyltransferase family 2 protein [Deltaproteobacteria bacterium]|nr:glycosyltransferase family 2 protein [Deltaproteobacteria bacterium]